ncbi:hypothetical protein BJX63DRAFT_373043 [Aspergillus granulosus]|uniref:Uncharacterized protein n=1 Tax=Aspergillus granulosus TaxID=176169 RepID=A0ABR4H0V6_9EURO
MALPYSPVLFCHRLTRYSYCRSACSTPSLLRAFCTRHVGLVRLNQVLLQPFTDCTTSRPGDWYWFNITRGPILPVLFLVRILLIEMGTKYGDQSTGGREPMGCGW